MLIFGISCIMGAMYGFFVLEETTGKALDTIPTDANDCSAESGLQKWYTIFIAIWNRLSL